MVKQLSLLNIVCSIQQGKDELTPVILSVVKRLLSIVNECKRIIRIFIGNY